MAVFLDGHEVLDRPIILHHAEVRGTSPEYRAKETDQVAPAGMWEWHYEGDEAVLRRATAADWSTAEDWITLDKPNEEILFGKDVALNGVYLRFGEESSLVGDGDHTVWDFYSGQLRLIKDGGNMIVTMINYDDDPQNNPTFRMWSARGTQASPAALQAADAVMEFTGYGYTGTSWQRVGRWYIDMDNVTGQTISNTSMPGAIHLDVCMDGAVAPTERLRISSNQNVGIGSFVTSDSIADRLHVRDQSANEDVAVRVENDVQAWRMGVFGSDSDKFKIRDETNTIDKLVIGTDGTGQLHLTTTDNSHVEALRIDNQRTGGWGVRFAGYLTENYGANTTKEAGRVGIEGDSAWTSAATSDARMIFSVLESDVMTDYIRLSSKGAEIVFYKDLEFRQAATIRTTADDLTLDPASHVLIASGVELQMNNTGGYIVLAITDSDSSTEAAIWYSASDNKLEFFNGSDVEQVTSGGFLWQAYENPTIYRQMYSDRLFGGVPVSERIANGEWEYAPRIPGLGLEKYQWAIGDKAIMVVESFGKDGQVHALPYPFEQALRESALAGRVVELERQLIAAGIPPEA